MRSNSKEVARALRSNSKEVARALRSKTLLPSFVCNKFYDTVDNVIASLARPKRNWITDMLATDGTVFVRIIIELSS